LSPIREVQTISSIKETHERKEDLRSYMVAG